MVKKLVSKAEFARLCGVSGAAVTKASSASLKPAVYGKKIDADHPAAIAYLESKTAAKTPPPATGIDPLYEAAIELCEESGRYTSRSIRTGLGIGTPRADAILAMMTAAGLVPEERSRPKPTRKPRAKMEPPTEKLGDRPPTTPKPPRKKPGAGAVKEKKKAESLAALSEASQSQSIDKADGNRTSPAAIAMIEPSPPGPDVIDVPEEIGAFIDMTLREVIQRFGTDAAFCDWLKATKEIEAIEEKRLKNAQTRGELVSRNLVKIGVIEPIDTAHIKLLTDGAKTIARRSTAMHGAGRTVEDIEKFVAEQMTSFIRPIKSRVAKALRNA